MKEMTYACPDGVTRTWKEWADYLFSGEPWYDEPVQDQSEPVPIACPTGGG